MREITTRDLEPHVASWRALKVRWVVFSGGEPLMHSHLPALSRAFRAEGIRVTILTAGLLLARQARLVAENVDDVIVSLDGPPAIHDRIRGVPNAYARLAEGVEVLRWRRADIPVHARCTVQKHNHRHLRETVRTAQALRLNSISFLAVDVTSAAFNRPQGWPQERQADVALDATEVEELSAEVEALIAECHEEMQAGFVVEDSEKLQRIVRHFRAQLGQLEPTAPRCNAPWVSAVVEADGAVRPCFFHRPFGNLRDGPFGEVLNSAAALKFRRQLDVSRNPICRRCVCSLYLESQT